MEMVTTEPRELTGRQLLDEPFLRERGWTQDRLDAYWLEGPPAEPGVHRRTRRVVDVRTPPIIG